MCDELSKTPEAKEKTQTDCNHTPQCTLRQPQSPPIGPKTLIQYNLQNYLDENEATEKEIDAFVNKTLEVFKMEPVNDLNFTIAKLQAIKQLIEPNEPEDMNKNKFSEFDDLISQAKKAKEYQELTKEIEEEAEDDFGYDEDYEDYPRCNYDADGNELHFTDDEN